MKLPSVLPSGHCLHRYRIEAVLGSGAFGVTYKAVHEALPNLRYAIKEYLPVEGAQRGPDGIGVYPNAYGQRPIGPGKPSYYDWGLKRFLDEARTLADIDHPHVVRVRDYFPANGTAYLVMDYEDGETLSAVLVREKTLPEARVRGLLEEMLAALEAVHAKGYLHRDLKPNNLYVRARDGGTMLIDFGAARQALAPYTRTITNLVTPGYSPLEQYVTSDIAIYGPWTDLYALGAVLYQCITGTKPLEAPSRQLGRRLVPAVEAGAGRYTENLLVVVDRALAMELDKRFESAAEMRAALVRKPAPGPTPPLKPDTRKRRWRVWVLAGILLLLVTGSAALFMREAGDDKGSAQTPKQAEERTRQQAEAEQRRQDAEAARQQAEAEQRRRAEEAARRQAEEAARKQRTADDQAFETAKGANTLPAYQGYLQNCAPLCAHRAEADAAIEKLKKPKVLAVGEVFRDNLADGSKGPEMVVIGAGEFQIGSPDQEEGRGSDERRHRVRIEKPFAIGKYEVTFEEYDRFAEATGRRKPDDRGWGRGRRPVINVSWNDAVAYAEWLSGQTGQTYRLPTEAEWEYAARAGTQTAYWWGDTIGEGKANCGGCGSRWDAKQTAPVGSFAANPFKLYDTAGNVWEWTCSAYEADYQGGEGHCVGNDGAGASRVLRGGSWSGYPRGVRASNRDWYAPGYRGDIVGLRLARTLTL